MHSAELRQRYLDFFAERGHIIIPGASLIPENDASVLFTTAGMQPLVPFFAGTRHPAGQRLVDYQRCLRTVDIDAVGDNSHLTCFEMLGNWSLDDYFKAESLNWCWEFLAELGLDRHRLAVTIFAGDADVAKDDESLKIWQEIGLSDERIFAYPKSENFWGPPGATGPCGPDSEIFYWTGDGEPESEPRRDSRWLEVWNSVAIQYRFDGQRYHPLGYDNIDTGLGLERVSALLQGVTSVYETDIFAPIMTAIAECVGHPDQRSERIIADHIRAAVMLIGDGARPGNLEQGYITRQLLRRAIRHGRLLGIDQSLVAIAAVVIDHHQVAYPLLEQERVGILDTIAEEEARFAQTLARGLSRLERAAADGQTFDGAALFHMFETDGLPLEVSLEELRRLGAAVDDEQLSQQWETARQQHRQRSRQGMETKFSGGLANQSPAVVELHTATHLLNAALRSVLGAHVHQRGSNITEERLRFDFSHSSRLSDDQLGAVEDLVNQWIEDDLLVEQRLMDKTAAQQLGAEMEFSRVYPDQVSVYAIGDVSLEFCAGPHVEHTGQLGRFQIGKQSSVGAGVRRLKATLRK
jgi:alanyl-tRNA synthetase